MDDFDKYLNEQLKNPDFRKEWELLENEERFNRAVLKCRGRKIRKARLLCVGRKVKNKTA